MWGQRRAVLRAGGAEGEEGASEESEGAEGAGDRDSEGDGAGDSEVDGLSEDFISLSPQASANSSPEK